jgi:HlyD family secretion protein
VKPIVRILLLGLLVAVVGGGVWVWRGSKTDVEAGQLILYGNVDVRQVELAINGSERIARILVEEGDRVDKAQMLAQLQLERFEIAVRRAKAQVETQQQVVARLEAGSREEEIRKVRADLEEAMAAMEDSARTHKRILQMLPSKAASQQQADDAKAAYERATARVKAVQALLDLALAGPRKEDIAEAKALQKRNDAELALAEYNMKDAKLYAPSEGIIQERLLEVGDMASPERPVLTLALIDPVWVRAYAAEPDLGKIWEGMKAAVVTDSFPNRSYEGWIGFISPTAEFTPKPVETTEVRTKLVYQVRAYVHNPNNELRLGMPATVRIPLDQQRPDRQRSRPAPGADAKTSR